MCTGKAAQLSCESDSGKPDQGTGIYVQSETKAIQAFKGKLERSDIQVTVRREMGRDIDGACGQLRRRVLAGKKTDTSLCSLPKERNACGFAFFRPSCYDIEQLWSDLPCRAVSGR